MILHKLVTSLRNQDWTTAFLEVCIVVVGLLIGLQVDDWNQARLDRKEAAYHVQFLHDELVREKDATAEEIDKRTLTLKNSFGASQLLDKTNWDEEDRAQFQRQIFSTFELWGPKHRPVSLRRLIDGGKLDLIESRDLQEAILAYESAYLNAIEQTRTSYSYSLKLTPQITSELKFVGPNIVNKSSEILDNRQLRAVVRDKAVWQRIQLDLLHSLQSDRLKLLEFLEARMQ